MTCILFICLIISLEKNNNVLTIKTNKKLYIYFGGLCAAIASFWSEWCDAVQTQLGVPHRQGHPQVQKQLLQCLPLSRYPHQEEVCVQKGISPLQLPLFADIICILRSCLLTFIPSMECQVVVFLQSCTLSSAFSSFLPHSRDMWMQLHNAWTWNSEAYIYNF